MNIYVSYVWEIYIVEYYYSFLPNSIVHWHHISSLKSVIGRSVYTTEISKYCELGLLLPPKTHCYTFIITPLSECQIVPLVSVILLLNVSMSEIEMIWFPVLREDCKKNPSILVEISPVDKHLSCIKHPEYSMSVEP